tara:strand:+ start:5626 stop:6849 length:1224 start_codon:yes stop_codon:yes gene_type:complete
MKEINILTEIRLFGDWAPCSKKVFMESIDEFSLINIEGPFKKNNDLDFKRAQKAGPYLFNNTLPEKIKNCVAILANNHLMDYGEIGFENTIKELNKLNINYVGAGKSYKEASKPYVFSLDGSKIALFARAEKQFGISYGNYTGVAPIDANFYKELKQYTNKVDLIILSIHGGAEMSPWPSPDRQDLYRSFIDMGVNVVYGHHSHRPQGWEKYQDGLIFYGLGNFCVDPSKWRSISNTLWSFSPIIKFDKGNLQVEEKVSLIEDNDENIVIKDATEKQISDLRNYKDNCNYPLKDRKLLIAIWQEFSMRNFDQYYSKWLSVDIKKLFVLKIIIKNIIFFVISLIPSTRINKFLVKSINKRDMLFYHLFSTDAHSEAIQTALSLKSGIIKDQRSQKTKDLFDLQKIEHT